MSKKLNVLAGALALAIGGLAFAQTSQPPSTTTMPSTANPSSSTPSPNSPSPSTATPAGVTPATPATPASRTTQPATPAIPASPALTNRSDNTTLNASGGNLSSFSSLDMNHDTFLSQSEIASDTMLTTDFAKYDTNHDGKLSESEFAHYRAQIARNKSTTNPNDRR